MQSPELKGMTVAAAIAILSGSLLAVDAVLDLNVSGFAKRLESAQASIADAVGQHQLAFAVRTWARGNTPPEQQCPRSSCKLRAAGTRSFRKQEIACRSAIVQAFGPSQKKMVGARGFEPPTPSLPD